MSKLLAGGADPDVTNHDANTALELANGREVKKLLRAVAQRQPSDDSATTGQHQSPTNPK